MSGTLITAYVGALIGCYWAGYKWGAAVGWIRKLGSVSG